MKPTPTILAASSLLALLNPAAVRAEDDLLSFDLSTPQWVEQASVPTVAAGAVEADPNHQPLPIPAHAANPPMRFHSPQQLPAGVYRRGVAVALNESTSPSQLLPPAPPLPANHLAAAPPQAIAPVAAQPSPPAPMEVLDFAVEPSATVVLARAKAATVTASNPLPSLFEGSSDSLVAWAVGSAEGTRTPNGAVNPAYYGHTDPGNRAWNMGTFSYQHGATTPTEADQKQLARLQNQGEVLRQRALKHGLNLTLEETINGLDLANQSPLAAIGSVGYIERLVEAKANGFEGSEAILVARTRSYINPKTGRWNAPGLGNTEPSIRRDQKRRADAVAQAIAAYAAQNPQLQPSAWTLSPPPEAESLWALEKTPTEPVDDILQMWTSPSDPVVSHEAPVAATAPDPDTPEDPDPLAGLWQITLEKVAQATFTQGTPASPQIASLGTRLFHHSPAPDAPAAESVTAEGDLQPSDRPETTAVSEPLAIPPSATAAVPSQPSLANPGAIASPSWAEVREGNQDSLAAAAPAEATTVVGAFPDSNVYLPTSQTSENQSAEPFPRITKPSKPITPDIPQPLNSAPVEAKSSAPDDESPPLAPAAVSLVSPAPNLPVPETSSPGPEAEAALRFAPAEATPPEAGLSSEPPPLTQLDTEDVSPSTFPTIPTSATEPEAASPTAEKSIRP